MADIPIYDHVEAFYGLLTEDQKKVFDEKFPDFNDPTRRRELTVDALREMRDWITRKVTGI